MGINIREKRHKRALAAGCDDYETKPAALGRLATEIRAPLGESAKPWPESIGKRNGGREPWS